MKKVRDYLARIIAQLLISLYYINKCLKLVATKLITKSNIWNDADTRIKLHECRNSFCVQWALWWPRRWARSRRPVLFLDSHPSEAQNQGQQPWYFRGWRAYEPSAKEKPFRLIRLWTLGQWNWIFGVRAHALRPHLLREWYHYGCLANTKTCRPCNAQLNFRPSYLHAKHDVCRSFHFSLADGWSWSWSLHESGIGRNDILRPKLITREPIVLSLWAETAAALWSVCKSSSFAKPISFRAYRFIA